MIANKKYLRPKPVALIMLEGWGVAPAGVGNQLVDAAPYFSHLAEHYPVAVLEAAGRAIGLPVNMPSNGEIAHTVIGSGKKFFFPSQIINEKIEQNNFASSEEFSKLASLISHDSAIHLIGLLSSSETEASINQLVALVQYLSSLGENKIYLHIILDGRETSKNSGQKLVEELMTELANYKNCQIISLIGRLYALDEKDNFSRTAKAAKLFIDGEGTIFVSPQAAFDYVYEKNIFDEEFPPAVIKSSANEPVKILDDDVVIFWNHSSQGIKQLTNYFLATYNFKKVATLTDYSLSSEVLVLFPKPSLADSLGSIFSKNNLKQLRLAESSGFANVSLALEIGSANFLKGVDKKIIEASIEPNLAADLVKTIKETRRLFNEAIQKSVYDLIIVNFSQLDTIAHHHNRDDLATVINVFDDNIKLMVETIEASGGVAIIVGTHGLVEQTFDPTSDQEIFSHSLNLVPLYLVGKRFEGYNLGWPEAVGGDLSLLKPLGSLLDIAPTILTLADLPIPQSMEGKSLI